MKLKELLIAFFIGIILPGMVFTFAERILLPRNRKPTVDSTVTEPSKQQIQPPSINSYDRDIVPVLLADGIIQYMEQKDYLVGVLLGEMPMDFDLEALKAQSVVARTYMLRRCTAAPKHNSGAICVNSSCCQSFCLPETYLSRGGSVESVKKAEAAVSATSGKVITYNGALIEATYFSCSGGRTEAAVAVWGADIPYLQAVDSPGEEMATHYTDSVSFTSAEFANALGISLSGSPANWFGRVTYTTGNGVDTIEIGGITFKGTELRQKLGIKSTAFSVTPLGDKIHISTRGFGHRVGMSQYGAEAMAVAGSDYVEILSHYYPGTSISQNDN